MDSDNHLIADDPFKKGLTISDVEESFRVVGRVLETVGYKNDGPLVIHSSAYYSEQSLFTHCGL